MEAITIIQRHECLPFSELSEDVQEKVMEQHRDWNADYGWWDSVYDWFEEHCRSCGIEVDTMHFSGFWSQGDGAAFNGKVTDIDKFLDTFGVNLHIRGLPFHFTAQAKRLIRYMVNDCGLRLEACTSGRSDVIQSTNFDRYNINPHEDHARQEHLYNAAELVLDTLKACWSNICTDLASELYQSLEQEYDYLTGIEALSATFDANECLFDSETGELFYKERKAA